MTINTKRDMENLTIAIEGRLDTITAPELEKVINEQTDGINQLTIDMDGLDYVSSAGLRVLLAAQKKFARLGGLKVKNVCSDVLEVFDMTGFKDILDIE